MDLISPSIQAYAEQFSSADNDLLQEVFDYTCSNHPRQHMISGHLQGKVLTAISYMLRPERILEVGTFTGYSALCLAEGLAENGILHTLELREDDAATAQSFFNKSSLGEKIRLHTGDALTIIPNLEETWDLVFLDADKTGYQQYFDLILPRLRPNGFILADNVFFHGDVTEEPVKGKNAKAIHSFNDYITRHPLVEVVILTLRDGLSLIRKK